MIITLAGNTASSVRGPLCRHDELLCEKNTQYTMNDLVNRYASSEGSLIVVADERRFQPSGGLRPLYHEPFCRHIGRYDRVYEAFVEHYGRRLGMPLRDTKNLFVQDNANLYELVEGDPVRRRPGV